MSVEFSQNVHILFEIKVRAFNYDESTHLIMSLLVKKNHYVHLKFKYYYAYKTGCR